MSAAAMNPQYRVEHVAETPRGWRVRTKMMSTHVLRIAFPPKGKGSKVIEIMHPVNENPCALNPAHEGEGTFRFLGKKFKAKTVQKARRRAFRYMELKDKRAKRGNPDAMGEGEHLYREFHGTDPREIVEMQESDAARHTFTALGDLSQLVINAPAGTVKIDFSRSDAVKVASAPGATQLYLIGGNQNLDSAIEQFGSDPRKDFVELGEGKQITYSARKAFDNFQLVDYYHNLGEETGERPILFYDRMKKRIFFVGGRYRVEAPGIIN